MIKDPQVSGQWHTSGPNDSATQRSQVSLTTLKGHSHAEFKNLQLPSSELELKNFYYCVYMHSIEEIKVKPQLLTG